MKVLYRRCAGLDVHKDVIVACARVTARGKATHTLRRFSAATAGLLELGDWLEEQGCAHVAMEATGVYWKPVWAVLEDRFECLLVNARHVKQVPGRKTHTSDAAWLCQLLEAGLLRGSFVPPKPIRALRTLTRYRKAQIKERQREANRLHKGARGHGHQARLRRLGPPPRLRAGDAGGALPGHD